MPVYIRYKPDKPRRGKTAYNLYVVYILDPRLLLPVRGTEGFLRAALIPIGSRRPYVG